MKKLSCIQWFSLTISIITTVTHFFSWFVTDTPEKDLPIALIILTITGPLINSNLFLICKGRLSRKEAIAASLLPLVLGGAATVPLGYRLYVGVQNGNWMHMKELQPAYWMFEISIVVFILLAEYSFWSNQIKEESK